METSQASTRQCGGAGRLRWLAQTAALLALAGCATQYDRFRDVSLRRLTIDQAFDRLDEYDIAYHFQTCEQVASAPSRPLAACRHRGAQGIVFALVDNGHYRLGVGSAYVQLYIELGADHTVVEVREETVSTIIDW